MKARNLPKKGILVEIIENLLKKELSVKMGARSYERTKNHHACGNDHYFRSLLIKYRSAEDIRIPWIGEATSLAQRSQADFPSKQSH